MLGGMVIVGATMTVISIASPTLIRTGICLLPNTGALEMSARMRASGKINAAIHAVSCALVTLIILALTDHPRNAGE